MAETPEVYKSPTGASLAFRHWTPAGEARATLLVCHGLGEHSGRYCRLAEAMAERGFATLAHDHRGHGLTVAPDAPRGRFAWRGGAEKVVADVLAMRDHAGTLHPGRPVFLFGHSMGGLIALNAAMTAPERFAGAAPWNMNAVPGRFLIGLARCILKAERALKGSDVPADIVPRLTLQAWNAAMPDRRTDADWLSHDPAEVDAVLADPLCGHPASVSLWLDLFDLVAGWPERPGHARARALPFFLLGGGEDPGTENGKAVARLAARLRADGFSSVKSSIYRYTRHDTLHDTGRDEAIAELAAWCDAGLEDRRGEKIMPEIVKAAPADRAAVEAVVEAAYSHYIACIGTTPGPMRDDYAAAIESGHVNVLRDETGVAGLLVLVPEEDALLLDNVAVSPAAQGKGYGRLLMNFAEAEARRLGYAAIRLYTHELMTENQAIYARRGYVETHRAEEKGLKRVFMRKPLA